MKIADRPQLFHLKILGAENTATNLQIKFRANIPEGEYYRRADGFRLFHPGFPKDKQREPSS